MQNLRFAALSVPQLAQVTEMGSIGEDHTDVDGPCEGPHLP
jgi:hypothetical protein